MNLPHYHKVEFLCRKCNKIQEQLVLCGKKDGDCPCMFCGETKMWLGNFNEEKVYPKAVISPIQEI